MAVLTFSILDAGLTSKVRHDRWLWVWRALRGGRSR